MKTYKPGDDHPVQLFDTGEMEHVCDLVRDSYDPAPEGHRSGLAQSLTRLLLRPVESFIDRLHETGRGASAAEFDAADELRTCVENVAKLLTMSDDGTEFASCTKDEAGKLADDLRAAWTRFIAYAGAYRMYSDLPREWERTAGMRASRATAADHARGDHERIRADYAELKAAGERNIAKKLATKYNRNDQDIRNIWSKRSKTKI
jgi:hypothetical protein